MTRLAPVLLHTPPGVLGLLGLLAVPSATREPQGLPSAELVAWCALWTITFRRASTATRALSALAKRHWCSCWAWIPHTHIATMPTQKSAPLSSEATPWAAADSPGSGTDSTIARDDVLASILLTARMAGGVCVDVQNGTRMFWLTLPPTKQQDAQAAGPPDATTTQQRTMKASRPPSYYRRSTERLQDRIAENQAKHQPRPDQQPPRMPPGMPPTMPPPPAAAVADAMDADEPPLPPPEEPPPPPPRPHQQPHQQSPTAEPRMPQPDVQQQPADPSPTVIAPKPAHTGSGVAATASMDPPPWCRHRLHGAATAATAPLPKRSRSLEDAFNDASDDSKRPENDSTLALRRAPPPPPPQAPPLLPPGLAAEPRPLATAWSMVVVRGALRTPPRPVASRERSQPASPFPPGWQNLGLPRRTSPAAAPHARLALAALLAASAQSVSGALITPATAILTSTPVLVYLCIFIAAVAAAIAAAGLLAHAASTRCGATHVTRHCAATLGPAHRRPYFRDNLVLPSPTSLHATSTTSTIKPLREKQLVAVALSARWLRALDSVNTFVFPLTPPPGPPTASLAPHTTCAPGPLCHPSRLTHREISPP